MTINGNKQFTSRIMVKKEYTYTGNMPSGNPFTWYYDEEKRTAFGTSEEAQYWTQYPKIGDKIVYWKSGQCNEIVEKVYINGKLVFERNEKTERKKRLKAKNESENLLLKTKRLLKL